MVNFAGKYALEKNENFVEYLQSLDNSTSSSRSGIPAAIAQKVDGFKTVITVSVSGNSFTLHNDNGTPDTVTTLKFEPNQTFEENLLTGNKVTTTVTVTGNSISLKSVDGEGHSGERIYQFSDGGLEIHYTASDSTKVVAKRIFKRA